MGCFELELELCGWEFGLRSRLRCDFAFRLTIVVHFVASASPALGVFGACEKDANFLFAESSAVLSSTISAFRAAISLLSSVATALLQDREQGMQTNVEDTFTKRLLGTPAQ